MNGTSIILRGVRLGRDVVIEDFCIVGAVPRGGREGNLETWIGDGSFLRSHTVVYAGNRIGDRFQTGNKVNIRESNEIGDDVSIGTLSVVEHHVRIGNGVRIHSQAFIPEFSVIEDYAWIGPNVVFTNARYPQSPGAKDSLKGPVIRSHARIGANTTILPGVTIGRNALVGAGSVVTKDVPDGCVVAGNPARVINTVNHLPYSEEHP